MSNASATNFAQRFKGKLWLWEDKTDHKRQRKIVGGINKYMYW